MYLTIDCLRALEILSPEDPIILVDENDENKEVFRGFVHDLDSAQGINYGAISVSKIKARIFETWDDTVDAAIVVYLHNLKVRQPCLSR